MVEDKISVEVDRSALLAEWHKHREEVSVMATKVDSTYTMVSQLVRHAEHLTKLDTIASAIVEIKDSLIAVATGKQQIPMDVAKELFSQARKDNGSLTKTYGLIVITLLAVMLFLLTGEKLGLIRNLVAP